MKILIVSDNFPPKSMAGAENVAFRQVKTLISKGHEVFVFTTTKDKKEIGWVEFEGVKICYFWADYNERWRSYLSLFNPWVIFQFKKELEKLKPEIVHFHNIHFYFSYYCFKVAKKTGAKVFLTAHDVMLFHYDKLTEFINPKDLACPEKFNYKISIWQQIKRARKRYNPLRNMIIRHYLKYVDKVFAVSYALKEALKQNGVKNVEVVHNGIDALGWQLADDKINVFKAKYNLIGKKTVLFGGRLSYLKGSDQIILAMEEVVKKIPNAVLLMVGRGALGPAQKADLKEKIIFTGWISGDELKAAYHASDVVVAPSICFDSFPTVILEAMACKKPVVATCFGGAKEMARDGESGFIVNPYNIELMARKIIEILSDEKLAAKMGEKGFETVKNNFTLENQAENYLSFLK